MILSGLPELSQLDKALCWAVFYIGLVIVILTMLGCCRVAGKADEDSERMLQDMPKCDKDADKHTPHAS